MIKFYNKLQFRLTISFVLLIILISGFSYYYTYAAAKDAIKQTVREELMTVTNMVVSQIDSQRIEKILSFTSGDDNNTEYIAQVNYLRSFRKNDEDISNFYIMKKDGEKLFFALDDLQNAPAQIGEEYTEPDPQLLKAFAGESSASLEFYSDKWGTFLSGYVPIRNAQGDVIAILGSDMKVDKAIEKQNFIGSLIYIVMGLAILAAALIIFLFSATIIRDINALTKVAQKISNGDLDFELPNIKAKNEIGQLNKAMMSVLSAMEFLKEVAEEKSFESEEGDNNGC